MICCCFGCCVVLHHPAEIEVVCICYGRDQIAGADTQRSRASGSKHIDYSETYQLRGRGESMT